MRPDEKATTEIARIICARTMSGFCKHVGGGFGCKVGRGTSDHTQCVANEDQLILSGYMATAEKISGAVRDLCADEVKAFRESVEDSEDLETLEHAIRTGGTEL